MRIPIIINKKQAKKLKKLYKGTKNNVVFVDLIDDIYDKLEKGKPLHKIIDDKKSSWQFYFNFVKIKLQRRKNYERKTKFGFVVFHSFFYVNKPFRFSKS